MSLRPTTLALVTLIACANTNEAATTRPAESAPSKAASMSPATAMKKARALAREGELASAAQWAQRASELDPRAEDAYLLWGSCCEQTGDLDCARRAYDQGLAAMPRSALLLRESGLVALQREDVTDAVAKLERSVEIEASAEARSDLAFAYLFAGRPEDALTSSSGAVTEEPTCFLCWMARAEILTRTGDVTASVTAYEKAVSLQPEDVDARAGLAKAYYRTGRSQDAFSLFEKLIGEQPEDLRLRVQGSQAAMAAGQPARAVEHLEVVAAGLPDDRGVLEALLRAQVAAGQDAAAAVTRTKLDTLN